MPPKGKKVAKSASEPVKPSKTANWEKSTMIELQLDQLVLIGLVLPRDEIAWRAPEEETQPQPGQGEIIIFADHLDRGFRPPGSRFFRNILQYYGVRL